MIHSLKLRNFQAHKETEIEFDPGITAIVGSSDSGKTSILRSLYWNIQGKPAGMQMVSYWNRKKDGSPKEDTSAAVRMGDHEIARIRNPDLNGYIVDGEELSSIGREVPDRVTSLYGLSDINIARQFDQHFLLSESSGEVARRLNELVHLDVIDTTLSTVESMRRDTKKQITTNEELLASTAKALDSFGWCDKAQELVAQYKEAIQKKNDLNEKRDTISTLVETIKKYDAIVSKKRAVIRKASKILEALQDLYTKRKEVQTRKKGIQDLLAGLQRCAKQETDFDAIRPARPLLSLLNKKFAERKDLAAKKAALSRLVSNYKDYLVEGNKQRELAKKLRKEFPSICPTCGEPMEVHDE